MKSMIAAATALTALLGAPPLRAEPVTLINLFEAPEGALDQTVRYWEAARDFMAKQPGYLSTNLHRAIAPDARFQLINVAVWESPEAFRAAMARMQAEFKERPPEGLRFTPALYRVFRQ